MKTFFRKILSGIADFFSLGFHWILSVLTDDPETYTAVRKEIEQQKAEDRAYKEKIAEICREAPEMAKKQNPDTLMDVIEKRSYSADVRSEAYGRILGKAADYQPERDPMKLTAPQRERLVRLICEETDAGTGISFRKFSNHDGLISIYEHARAPELRVRAMERILDLDSMLIYTFDKDHPNNGSRSDYPAVFDLSDEEAFKTIGKQTRYYYVSELRGVVWRCLSQEELRDALLLAQREDHEWTQTRMKQTEQDPETEGEKNGEVFPAKAFPVSPWKELLRTLIRHISEYGSWEFLISLIGDPQINDRAAKDFLHEFLTGNIDQQLLDRAEEAYLSRDKES